MQSGRLVIMEPLPHHFFLPDVEWGKAQGDIWIGDRRRPFQPGELPHLDPARRLSGNGGRCRQRGFGDLLVEEGGEEVELVVTEGKAVAPLVDAPLAQDDRLAAGPEEVADDGPFFES